MSKRIVFSYRDGSVLEFAADEYMAEYLGESDKIERWFFVQTPDGCIRVDTRNLLYVQLKKETA